MPKPVLTPTDVTADSSRDSSRNNLTPEIIHLLPNQVHTSPQFEMWGDVDPETGAEADDDRAIQELAASIERDGQQDAIIVIPTPTPGPNSKQSEEFTVISGHRRRRAVMLINEQRSRAGKPLLRLVARVDRTTDTTSLERKALVTNMERKNFTPLHLAHVVKRMKANHPEYADDWKYKAMAKYFGVSVGTVSEAMALDAGLSPKLRRMVLGGELSAQSAKMLMQHTASHQEQEAVAERAKDMQVEANMGKALTRIERKRITGDEANAEVEKAAKPGRVERQAAAEALTEHKAKAGANVETQAATGAKGAGKAGAGKAGAGKAGGKVGSAVPDWVKGKRTTKEIREWVEGLDAPVFGGKDSPARQFAQYMLKWMAGDGTERTLTNKFEAVLSKAATKGSQVDAPDPAPKSKPATASKPNKPPKPAKPAKPAVKKPKAKQPKPKPKAKQAKQPKKK